MTHAFVPTALLALALKAARTGAAVAAPVVRGLTSAIANRVAVQRLTDLDDRALKDIGLTRGDVAGALSVPLHVDPSAILSDRRRARTDGRVAQALRPGHLPQIGPRPRAAG
jgi:uncharacterized protein YjiS (DUF1127 family)